MNSLDLFGWSPSSEPIVERDTKPEKPTIEQRFATWSAANKHVLDEMLRLAREQLDAGAKYLSVKRLYEELRVSLSATREGGYRLNNDFTAPISRWLLEVEPRLAGVIELRKRKKP